MQRTGDVVDPIGAKPIPRAAGRLAPVSGSAAAPQVDPVTSERGSGHAASVAAVAREAARSPPVDHQRVAVLRAAIANGDFRPSPETVADRMIGAMHEWIAK
jgi:flagellar biosynthesis anti-sigma factor FlgM